MTTVTATTTALVQPAARREISPAVRATAELFDQRFRIPGLGFRFGVDALIGLVPLVGDVLGMVLGYGLIVEAFRLRASWRTIAKMLGNLWLDAALGVVPIIGDLFDFFFQANRKNLALLERELAQKNAA
jgi:hypothetical protein